MIDSVTNERITVDGQALTGSHIMVPIGQLQRVTVALTGAGVTFWVDEEAIQFEDGEPPIAFVKLSRSSNTATVQHLLDEL